MQTCKCHTALVCGDQSVPVITAVSDTGKALPDDIKVSCTYLDLMHIQHLHVCLQGPRALGLSEMSCSAQHEAMHQTLLEIDLMLQVLKAVFTGLFTAGIDGIRDQQLLVKTTGEQHYFNFFCTQDAAIIAIIARGLCQAADRRHRTTQNNS